MEKRKIFKGLYKDKSFIKMICFVFVLLLGLILGSIYGYIDSDAAGGHLLNLTDYQSSSIYDSNIYVQWFGGDSTSERDSFVYDFLSTSLDISSLDTPSSFDSGSIKNFVTFGNSSTYDFYNYIFTDEAFFFPTSPYAYQWTVVQKGSPEYYYFDFTVTNPNNVWQGNVGNNSFTVMYFQEYFEVGNDRYYYGQFGDANHFPSYSNMNYYSFYNSVPYSSYLGYIKEYISNGTYSDVIKNINYLIDSSGLHGFDNTFPSGSSSSLGPNAGNYMYADYADWYLNNYTGDIANRYRTVSAVFTSNLNDYINDSLVLGDSSTDSPYTIDFDFTCFVDFYYSYITDSSDTSISLGNNFISGSIGSSSSVLNKTYYWAASYEAPDTMGNYLVGMHIDASTFADNNYIQEWPLSGLFAYMEPTDSYVVSENGQKNNISLSLQSLMTLISNGVIYNSSNEHVELRNFRLTCTATIQYGDAFDDVFGDIYRSGTYSETFDLLTGESSLNSDSMLTNYNPYVENTDTDYSNLPSTSTGTSSNSTSVTTGNVTQTVTVTNEGASYIPSLISKLLPTSLGDTGTGLVDTFSTMAQTNGWISVMASTVPAIPGTVWNYITDYLGISLYLLACAFVLRLILDLL